MIKKEKKNRRKKEKGKKKWDKRKRKKKEKKKDEFKSCDTDLWVARSLFGKGDTVTIFELKYNFY